MWAHSDRTIESLDLGSVGRVAWGTRNETTLHRSLVHMIAETGRHAGHADIVRELVDAATGLRVDGACTPPGDTAWWREHRDRVEWAAREAGRADGSAP